MRGGGGLEVKVYRGSPAVLEVAGCARGRMESWQKWSFACEPASRGCGVPAGWGPVRKRRRTSSFSMASGPARARVPGTARRGCEVELTEIRARGETWWSLGFEAAGPAGLLRSELEATAALVFAQALPGGMELHAEASRSYAQWLRRP